MPWNFYCTFAIISDTKLKSPYSISTTETFASQHKTIVTRSLATLNQAEDLEVINNEENKYYLNLIVYLILTRLTLSKYLTRFQTMHKTITDPEEVADIQKIAQDFTADVRELGSYIRRNNIKGIKFQGLKTGVKTLQKKADEIEAKFEQTKTDRR